MFRTLSISHVIAAAFIRFARTVTMREVATKTLEGARADAKGAQDAAEAMAMRATVAEVIFDDAQTEYESATAELTRALGGKAFDPTTGDLR